MSLRRRTKYRLFWASLGLGAALLTLLTISLQISSIRHHIPINYGVEPYSQDPNALDACRA